MPSPGAKPPPSKTIQPYQCPYRHQFGAMLEPAAAFGFVLKCAFDWPLRFCRGPAARNQRCSPFPSRRVLQIHNRKKRITHGLRQEHVGLFIGNSPVISTIVWMFQLNMVHIKSIVVGLFTGAMTMAVSTIVWTVLLSARLRSQFPNGEVSFDLRSMLGRPSLVWLLTLIGFGVGFYWTYRRGTP